MFAKKSRATEEAPLQSTCLFAHTGLKYPSVHVSGNVHVHVIVHVHTATHMYMQ